jgi:imidazolonepropionase
MQSILLKNIKQLVNVREDTGPLYGTEMAQLPSVTNAWLLIEGNAIAGFGKMETLKTDRNKLIAVTGW